MLGKDMYDFIVKLFPIFRSLTGNGVRQTLSHINEILPLKIYEVASGTKVFDWEVPNEWNIKKAYLEDEWGNRIVDIENNNLYVVGYSVPIDEWFELEDIDKHICSDEKFPNAIPYITSYYKKDWGFCMEHNRRKSLKPGKYHAVIDSKLEPGFLTYGECVLPGEFDREVLISTYVCHPSMANNELSGPALVTYLGKWLTDMPRKYTYRLIFIPETIGALVYMQKHMRYLKEKVMVAANVSCVGDNRCYSYLSSRHGDTYSDKVAKNVLNFAVGDYKSYSYLNRGSNEKIFCAPGFNLPMINITRSKFLEYPEYHTSLDNLDLVSPEGLAGSFDIYRKFITLIEKNAYYRVVHFGEPQLGKRDMYFYEPNSRSISVDTRLMKNFLAYADGANDLVDISNIIGVPARDLYELVELLQGKGLIEPFDRPNLK
jgi:aminopeptidase-like protein